MKKGDFVKLEYTGSVNNDIFDTTSEKEAEKADIKKENMKYGPKTIILGEGHILPGLEEELLKMKKGDKKKIELPPEKAFGKRDSKAVKQIPMSFFKNQNVKPQAGMVLNLGNQLCRISSVNSGRVMVDFNHPLAGKTVEYEVKIKEKVEKDDEKIEAILGLYGINPGKIDIKKKEAEIQPEKTAPKKVMEKVFSDIKNNTNIKKVKFTYLFP